MKDRWWTGAAVAAVFLVGAVAGHWYPGARSTRELVVEKKAEGETKATAAVDTSRTEDVVAISHDTGTERIEHRERRTDAGVEVETKTTRTFALRSYQREQEREQTRTVTEYVDRWHVEEKVRLVEKLREPRWSVSALAGYSLDARAPMAAVQVGGHLIGPLELTLQVQRTFAGGPLDGWAALAGVTMRW